MGNSVLLKILAGVCTQMKRTVYLVEGAPIFGRVLGLGFAGHRLAQVHLVERSPLLHIGDFLSNEV